MYGHKYTDEERKFFIEYVPGHTYKEIQKKFIEVFGWEITISQIKGYMANHRINNGLTGQFKKGNVPANKGQKMSPEQYEKCKGTMFKKGQKPINYRPVGSERINSDGYIEVKVKDPSKWMLKHRLVWEQSNGKIPPNCILIFRDNNKLNVHLENLLLITKRENLEINGNGFSQTIEESKDLALSLAKLSIATKQKKVRKT